jgi:hypothetical protein
MRDIKTMVNYSLRQIAQVAKKNATAQSETQRFNFEGVEINVDSTTNLDLLMRDYRNALILGRNTIGPDYAEILSPADISALEAANEARREASKAAQLLEERGMPAVRRGR